MSQAFIRKNDRCTVIKGAVVYTRVKDEPWAKRETPTTEEKKGIVMRTIPAVSNKSLPNMAARPRLVVVSLEGSTGEAMQLAFPDYCIVVKNDGGRRPKSSSTEAST